MAKYQCMCGWIYDENVGEPSQNMAPNTKFEDLPNTFKCPQCGLADLLPRLKSWGSRLR